MFPLLRRYRRSLLAVGVVVVVMATLVGSRVLSRESTKCRRAILRTESKPIDMQFVITDGEAIRKLIVAPLASAQPNPKPGDHKSYGTLELEMEDGTREEISLFHPLGLIDRSNKSLIVDFEPLRLELMRLIGNVEMSTKFSLKQ